MKYNFRKIKIPVISIVFIILIIVMIVLFSKHNRNVLTNKSNPTNTNSKATATGIYTPAKGSATNQSEITSTNNTSTSPEKTNNNNQGTSTPQPEITGALIFDKKPGFYNTNINLAITCNKSNYTIRYTLDSSEPNSNSPQYNSPISITNKSNIDPKSDQITIVRAAAFDGNTMINNKIYSATYIIRNGSFKDRYSTPVVSIITDNKNLYGSTGIFDNSSKKGIAWERPCHVDFFETDGSLALSQDAGLRLSGGMSRGSELKSLKLVARLQYGDGKFNHTIFPGNTRRSDSSKVIDEYNSFILRSGANDSVISGHQIERSTIIRDGLANRLASKTGLDFMSFRSAVVYINGKYVGIENLREDLSDDYIAEHYGIPEDQIAIMNTDLKIEANNPNPRGITFYYILDTDDMAYDIDYKAMIEFVATKNMSDPELYRQAGLKLDLDNFARYMAYEMYCGNTDWPQNNLRAWRYTGQNNSKMGQDGKWRYMLKDLDFAFGRYTTVIQGVPELYCDYDRDPFSNVFQNYYNDPLRLGAMFKNLLKNPTFKQTFKNEMNNLLDNIASPANAKAVLESIKNEIKGEIPYHFQKWNLNNNWESRLGNISTFMEKRPGYIKKLMSQYNELS